MLALYTSFQVFSALSGAPQEYRDKCSPLAGIETPASEASKWLGIFFAFFAIILVPMGLGGESEDSDWKQTEEEDADGIKEKNTDDEESEAVVYSYTGFHIIMLSGAAYGAMTITGWTDLGSSTDSASGQIDFEVNYGWASVYVKMASTWLANFFFLLDSACPHMFPGSPLPSYGGIALVGNFHLLLW